MRSVGLFGAIAALFVGGLLLGPQRAVLLDGEPALLVLGRLASPVPSTTLGRLCSRQVQWAPQLQHQVAAEITEAVRKAGGDSTALHKELTEVAGVGARPEINQGDVDGDGRRDTVITFHGCRAPAFVFRGAQPDRAYVLAPSQGEPFYGATVDRIGDVNQDGKLELVIEDLGRGTADSPLFYTYQWDGEAFRRIS